MTKTFIVAGSNWLVEVPLADIEHLTSDEIKTEAATRALERHFGKRKDLLYHKHEPLILTEKQKQEDELHATLVKLLTTEIEVGCGVGMLLCIMDNQDPATYVEGEDHEWWINSKTILENVGVPSLVKSFDKKFPKGS